MKSQSLQEKYAPNNVCWGCGPANPDGLHIRSFPKNGEVVAEWTPEKKYEAFDGVLNRSEEHTSELQSQSNLVCRLLLEKKKSNLSPTPNTSTDEVSPSCFRNS